MDSFETSDYENMSDQALMQGRDQLLDQMAWTRQYTLQLIEAVPRELWYAIPPQASSHVAWQVGHLAVAQYGLMLFRQRGRTPDDLRLMPGWLRKQFGRGTEPSKSDESMPEPAQLLERLSEIHAQSLHEVKALSADALRQPTDMPYTAYPTRLGALLFCPIHEALHAGQIGMLRRLHGLPPLR